jgi:hypothetical protein
MPKDLASARVYGRSSQNQKKADLTMMPIGVPKVAYRVPGSQSADWYVCMQSGATHLNAQEILSFVSHVSIV